jgi:hypothetical protein
MESLAPKPKLDAPTIVFISALVFGFLVAVGAIVYVVLTQTEHKVAVINVTRLGADVASGDAFLLTIQSPQIRKQELLTYDVSMSLHPQQPFFPLDVLSAEQKLFIEPAGSGMKGFRLQFPPQFASNRVTIRVVDNLLRQEVFTSFSVIPWLTIEDMPPPSSTLRVGDTVAIRMNWSFPFHTVEAKWSLSVRSNLQESIAVDPRFIFMDLASKTLYWIVDDTISFQIIHLDISVSFPSSSAISSEVVASVRSASTVGLDVDPDPLQFALSNLRLSTGSSVFGRDAVQLEVDLIHADENVVLTDWRLSIRYGNSEGWQPVDATLLTYTSKKMTMQWTAPDVEAPFAQLRMVSTLYRTVSLSPVFSVARQILLTHLKIAPGAPARFDSEQPIRLVVQWFLPTRELVIPDFNWEFSYNEVDWISCVPSPLREDTSPTEGVYTWTLPIQTEPYALVIRVQFRSQPIKVYVPMNARILFNTTSIFNTVDRPFLNPADTVVIGVSYVGNWPTADPVTFRLDNGFNLASAVMGALKTTGASSTVNYREYQLTLDTASRSRSGPAVLQATVNDTARKTHTLNLTFGSVQLTSVFSSLSTVDPSRSVTLFVSYSSLFPLISYTYNGSTQNTSSGHLILEWSIDGSPVVQVGLYTVSIQSTSSAAITFTVPSFAVQQLTVFVRPAQVARGSEGTVSTVFQVFPAHTWRFRQRQRIFMYRGGTPATQMRSRVGRWSVIVQLQSPVPFAIRAEALMLLPNNNNAVAVVQDQVSYKLSDTEICLTFSIQDSELGNLNAARARFVRMGYRLLLPSLGYLAPVFEQTETQCIDFANEWGLAFQEMLVNLNAVEVGPRSGRIAVFETDRIVIRADGQNVNGRGAWTWSPIYVPNRSVDEYGYIMYTGDTASATTLGWTIAGPNLPVVLSTTPTPFTVSTTRFDGAVPFVTIAGDVVVGTTVNPGESMRLVLRNAVNVLFNLNVFQRHENFDRGPISV